jgi:hypothetical protein
MTAPYLTDTVSLDKDLTGLDFCVALAHDGKTGSVNFNRWVDKAYKKCPLFAVVKPDPSNYVGITLGMWPPFENDPALKWMKAHFLAPDGKTKYAIAGVLLDMRSYYDSRGELYTGGWVAETVKHWRKTIASWGFKTFLFIGPELERLFPDNARDPAVFVQTEQNPIAVYETLGGTVCKWPLSKFLKRVSINEWESVISIDALHKLVGWVDAPVVIPPVVDPPPLPALTDSEKLEHIYKTCDRLNEFLDMLKSWQY